MSEQPILLDRRQRPLRQLRLSVTDRCNLRCGYCMPEEEYVWLRREQILSLEELALLARVFVESGVRGVRLTGGEPLLRRGLTQLVAELAGIAGIEDLALTTNAVHLAEHAAGLRAAGLHRITVSLDTLRRERFAELTRRDRFDEVLEGLAAAKTAGFTGTKLNVVVQRGQNDDELEALVRFGQEHQLQVRFIEYMDVGGATHWTKSKVVPHAEILQRLTQAFGPIEAVARTDAAPADRFQLSDGSVFGIIASTSRPFCGSCDRSRVTADGTWFRCLYARNGTPLRDVLRRDGVGAVSELVSELWAGRDDAGAEERFALQAERGPLQQPGRAADDDPMLEMRTRGG